MARAISGGNNERMSDRYLSAAHAGDNLIENRALLEENNKLLKEILEMLRKIAINTS